MSIGIVILAAGESARMGSPKQLLAYRGTTLLQHAVNNAESVPGARVAVVLGAHAPQILASLADPRPLVIENPDWREGMGGSIRSGLRALLAEHAELSSVIFQLCDQPYLSAMMLADLISIHEQTGAAIVASEYNGSLGVPAIFSRDLFPELLALEGATGAKQIIKNHIDQVIGLAFPAGAFDIDTLADFNRLQLEDQPLTSV